MPRLRDFLSALLFLLLSAATVAAAERGTMIRVALLDMTAVAGGATGVGMMSPSGGSWGGSPGSGGMMGFGMMGPGTMGGGMMGHGMMSIRADETSVKAGTVSFEVINWSRSVVHELVIVAVDSPTAPLPYDYNSWRVVEDQVKVVGETGNLLPNGSKTVEFKLAPGSYVLICNIAGHYAAGMALPLTVTP